MDDEERSSTGCQASWSVTTTTQTRCGPLPHRIDWYQVCRDGLLPEQRAVIEAEEGGMPVSRPMWLQGPCRPIFAWFHSPDDRRARAGVVLCPPLGIDYDVSHFAFRRLAEQLTVAGCCVMRFDYDGTGDSLGGPGDPDRVRAWLSSVALARNCLRRSGMKRISLVGRGLGATLAAAVAAKDGGIDQLVLWEPVASGSSFLAEQHTLSVEKLGGPATSEDGSVEVPGTVFDAATVRSLQELAVRETVTPLARRVLVLTRSDRPVIQALLQPTIGLESTVHKESVAEATPLHLSPPNQKLPLSTIRTVVDWLTEGAPAGSLPLKIPTEPSRIAFGYANDGQGIVETSVRVPPVGLFGILTEPESLREPGAKTGHPPAVIFLNVALQPHIGPSRLWVELARRWARAGLRSLRLDLSGLGDSPFRDRDNGQWCCAKPEAFDDVLDAARWMSPDDPSNVLLVGLCASGYQALEGALALRARGVVAINPLISFLPPEHDDGQPTDLRRRIALPQDAVTPSLRNKGRLGWLRVQFPDLAWRMRILSSPQQRSGRWLTELARQGTDTLIMSGDKEVRPIRQGITAFQLRRLERSGLLRFEHVRGLDHGLRIASHREMIAERVSEHVLDRLSCGGFPAERSPA